MITLTIDGKPVEVTEGTTVLRAAEQAGIEIPTLCDHPDLTPYGGCRLCVVEVQGFRTPMASCTLPASAGMQVTTDSPALFTSRRTILELLLGNYHDSGYDNGQEKETQLMRWVKRFGLDLAQAQAPAPRYPVNSDPNPVVWVDLNKCILCNRCIRACAEVQGRFVWGLAQRGFDTHISAGADSDLLTARCESCGACVAYCPTGALDNKPSLGAGKPDKLIRTTCAYCGVGCQFDVNVKDGKVIRVTSAPDAPVNGNHLCVKGRYGYDYVHHPERLLKPRVRHYLLEGGARQVDGPGWEWVETDWNTALTLTAQKLSAVRRASGPDSIGVLTSAKCTNEENYLMNKLARQVIGTNNIDHCARLCHASTVAGLATSFGSGAMSNSMDDVAANAAALFVIGSNTTEQHPVFGAMLRQAVLQRGTKLVVADPRRIELTEFAQIHLRQRPGTDIALVNGLMNIILEKGWEDKTFIAERCENFDEFRATITNYPPEKVSQMTGVPLDQLYAAAEILATVKPMAVIWAMGITQHITGTHNVMTLANLQMLTGNMGIPGGGVNPLRGQNNVQGACDMGGLPNVFPAYQPVTDPAASEKFSAAWQVSGGENPFQLSNKAGKTATEVIPQLLTGEVRALYILGEDPIMSDPDTNHVRHCLAAAEFIALQEIFPSETSRYADVLLPGMTFMEKTGTFTNTERRVQMVRQAIAPLGEARPDWQIICSVAKIMLAEAGQQASGPWSGWEYASPSAIMDEINALAPSYAGITHERLERGERLQWPVPNLQHPGTPILHAKGSTRGKGRFMPIENAPPAERVDADYPFVLSSGRVLYHWHGGEMTRRAESLMALYGQALIEISAEDADRLGIAPDGRVRVRSRRGVIEAQAWVTERVPAGMVYANFHFPQASANELTLGSLDPIAKIPEYKVTAVQVEKVA